MNLRNFFLLVFFVFFLTIFNFKNFNHVYAIDTFSSSTPLKNIINKNDATDFKDIKFIKNEKKKTRDGRLYGADIYPPKKFIQTFSVFKARFHSSGDIYIWVNSEFKSTKKIADLALKYSKMLGQTPHYFRSNKVYQLKWIVIHGPWVDKSKCTCAWYAIAGKGIYIHDEMIREQEQQEILIHELSHVSIDKQLDLLFVDEVYANSKAGQDSYKPVWSDAMKKDASYISGYAEKKRFKEDIAESAVAWVAVRCKKDRISKSVYEWVIKTIPNRLKVLDDLMLNQNMRPLTCKK